jgi:hypothetical protein
MAPPNQALDVRGSINVSASSGCVSFVGGSQVCGNSTDLVLQLGNNVNLTFLNSTGGVRGGVNSTCSYLKGENGNIVGAGSGC